MTDTPPVERIHIPMPAHTRALHTLEAVYAGMPTRSARRWPSYLDMKDRLGQRPIALDEAVAQCLLARAGVATDDTPAEARGSVALPGPGRQTRRIVTAAAEIHRYVGEPS